MKQSVFTLRGLAKEYLLKYDHIWQLKPTLYHKTSIGDLFKSAFKAAIIAC